VPKVNHLLDVDSSSEHIAEHEQERGKKKNARRLGPGGSDDKNDNGTCGYGVVWGMGSYDLSSVILHLQVGTLP
jgi:hypothetical protein